MSDRDIQEELEDGISAELEQERTPSTGEPETALEGNVPLETREESIDAPGIEEDRVRTIPETEGIPRQVKGVSSYDDKTDYIRDVLNDEFGFNPDISGFDTHGTVEVMGTENGIEMVYSFENHVSRTNDDGFSIPALGYVNEALLEQTLVTAYVDVNIEEDPSEELSVRLSYGEEDFIHGTEEALEVIEDLEELVSYE